MTKFREIYINRVREGERYAYHVSLKTGSRLHGNEFVTLLTCSNLPDARTWVEYFIGIPDGALIAVSLQSLAVLLDASMRAEKIALASDEQGTEQYATKAHMRSWARLISDSVDALRRSLKLHMDRAPSETEPLLELVPVDTYDLAALVENSLPGMNWHIARGRSTPTEPPYGAAILDGDEEIGAGEGDSPREALRAAMEAARAEIERRNGGAA